MSYEYSRWWRGLTVAVVPRPEHEVPMIGHQAISANSHGAACQRLFHASFEGLVVAVLREEVHPAHAPIQDVKDHTSRR